MLNYHQEIISEIAERCGDIEFRDFDFQTYYKAFGRANRDIAKKYQILEKVITFTAGSVSNDQSADILLDIDDFKSEIYVNVNGFDLVKVNNKFQPNYKYCYYLDRVDNKWYFNYILESGIIVGENVTNYDITEYMSKDMFQRFDDGDISYTAQRVATDEITIIYNCLPQVGSFLKSDFVIPQEYEEEQIRGTIIELAKIGIAKFIGSEEKSSKYEKLFRLYSRASEKDKFLGKNNSFIKIETFKFPD